MMDSWKIAANGHSLTRDKVTVRDTSHTVPLPMLEAVAREVWSLRTDYPQPRNRTVDINIKPASAFRIERDDQGNIVSTENGYTEIENGRPTGHVSINVRTFFDNDPGDGTMPVGHEVPEWLYVLAHEYGHTITDVKRDDDLWWEFLATRRAMSYYGRSSQFEAYAEAFAEWRLSRGLTENLAARKYAQTFGWK